MAVKPRASNPTISRPSSLLIRKILNTHLHKNQIPTSIWPSKPNAGPPLNAFQSFIHSPSHFPQILAQFFAAGIHHDPFTAGQFIKTLSFSSPSTAASVFSLLPNPDAFIANTILKSFLSFNLFDAAFSFYRHYVIPSFVSPNNFTFPLLAKLFAHLGKAQDGILMHTHIAKLGFDGDIFVCNSLIHMYSCFGDVGAARRIFDACVVSDFVTWNSMIDGYVKNGMIDSARELFDAMGERDVISWNVMIAGYMGVGDLESAKNLFLMMPERDVVSWNSMIDGYARIGEVGLAREIFDAMPNKNLVTWNIMLALYARVKDYRECLKLFDGMMAVGNVKPNKATFVSVLTTCANLGHLERGKWVHCLIKENGEECDVLLSTALLTMYAKCGAMDVAREVFDQMAERSIVSWNSMISGYGLHGHGEKAIELFLEMERKGPRPNENTFVCILSACTHGGLVVEGWWCFDRMVRCYGIEPKVEHFGCMIDLLGRAGLLKDSEELAKRLNSEPSKALWGALLSASRGNSDGGLGEIVAQKMIVMEPREVGPYVLLSNIYAAEGRWSDVEKVREMMRGNGVKKKAAGVSLVGGGEAALEDESSVGRKRMVYSMLGEMGARMKSWRETDWRQRSL